MTIPVAWLGLSGDWKTRPWRLRRLELPLAKETLYISQTPCLGAISVSFALWWIRSLVLNSRHDYLI